MNVMINPPSHPISVVSDSFCRHCGNRLMACDNFCGGCGSGCQDLIEIIDPESGQSVANVTASLPIAPPNSVTQIFEPVLNSRLAVIGVIAFMGPLGFPALWFSPRFSKPTKVITTVSYLLLTTVVPIAIAVYWLEYSMRPLVDVFGR